VRVDWCKHWDDVLTSCYGHALSGGANASRLEQLAFNQLEANYKPCRMILFYKHSCDSNIHSATGSSCYKDSAVLGC
jgi:hypothetical protein